MLRATRRWNATEWSPAVQRSVLAIAAKGVNRTRTPAIGRLAAFAPSGDRDGTCLSGGGPAWLVGSRAVAGPGGRVDHAGRAGADAEESIHLGRREMAGTGRGSHN